MTVFLIHTRYLVMLLAVYEQTPHCRVATKRNASTTLWYYTSTGWRKSAQNLLKGLLWGQTSFSVLMIFRFSAAPDHAKIGATSTGIVWMGHAYANPHTYPHTVKRCVCKDSMIRSSAVVCQTVAQISLKLQIKCAWKYVQAVIRTILKGSVSNMIVIMILKVRINV